jgi:hypothetical protein
VLDLFRSTSAQWRRLILFVIIASITVTPGCSTLGYIPEDVKPSGKTTTAPTYREVKKWAYDVADGYDTRATLNRYAIYGGALIGAAAAGAITGLAAFDSDSSALVGIPIGATFLGSVAAIYSNEEKARIYQLGAEYIKDLITLSDQRFYQCRFSASIISQEAQKAIDDAQKRLDDAQKHEELLQKRAKKAHEDVEKSNSGEGEDLEATIAKDIDNRKSEAVAAVAEAKANLYLAEQDKQDAQQCPTLKPEQLLEKEALCLRQDVNDVMRKVETHKVETHKAAKDVRSPMTKAEAGNTTGTGAATSSDNADTTSVSPVDLTDLSPPVKSQCGQF